MVVQQGVTNLETIEGTQADFLVTLLHGDFLGNADVFLRGVLLFNAGRLDQENERTGTAVHDRHFRRTHVDIGVINTQSGHG